MNTSKLPIPIEGLLFAVGMAIITVAGDYFHNDKGDISLWGFVIVAAPTLVSTALSWLRQQELPPEWKFLQAPVKLRGLGDEPLSDALKREVQDGKPDKTK